MGAHIFILESDSYKGSATSQEVESSIAEGIRSLLPDATIYSYPVADGGEGTVAALVAAGSNVRLLPASRSRIRQKMKRFGPPRTAQASSSVMRSTRDAGISLSASEGVPRPTGERAWLRPSGCASSTVPASP